MEIQTKAGVIDKGNHGGTHRNIKETGYIQVLHLMLFIKLRASFLQSNGQNS